MYRSWMLVIILSIVLSGLTAVTARAAEPDEQQENESLVAATAAYEASHIAFAPGRNETELNFAWYTPRNPAGSVIQYSEKAQMTGEEFPADAQTSTGTVSDANTGFSSNKATITGIKPSTEYVYRLGDGTNWGETYSFRTREMDAYSFLYLGDPQIGSSGNPTRDTEGFVNTLNKATGMFPGISFMLSAGDQVESPNNETEYLGYFTPAQLRQFPVATTIGNHDNSATYKLHFNSPNESNQHGLTSAGGNSYFTYGDALFMVLNTNNTNGDTHRAFIEETVAAVPDTKWRFVMNHQSIYSPANHSTSSSIVNLRAALHPIMDEFDIDVVFAGHDHSYVRSYQMQGGQPLRNQAVNEQGHVINPTGTLYMTANSSSGSKYYNLRPDPEPYAAVRAQLRTPTFANVELTPTSFTITTYRADTGDAVDTYTIVKDDSIIIETPDLAEITLNADGTTLPAEPSRLYPDVKLKVTGTNDKGGDHDVRYDSIVYKTSVEGAIAIAADGKVIVQDKTAAGQAVEVWAEVEEKGKTYVSNKMTMNIIEVEEKLLFEGASVWKYLDNGSDQGTAWRAAAFDDSTWKSGGAPLGYPASENRPEFGRITTLIGFGPSSSNKYATSYFRTEFTVDSLANIGDRGLVRFGIDDGVILYLNGHEIGRFNLPEGDIPYNYYSDNLANEDRLEQFQLNASHLQYLVEGKNVLAAEVHQDRPSSSDVYWDMELIVAGKKNQTPGKQAELSVRTKTPVLIKGADLALVYEVSLNAADAVNAIDAALSYDKTIVKLEKVELADSVADGLVEWRETADGVRIIAALPDGVTTAEPRDVIRLIFTPTGQASGNYTAKLELKQASTASKGENKQVASRIGQAEATITVKDFLTLSDVNGDGKVNIADLSLALEYYRAAAGDANWEQAKRADINGDGVVDITDFSIIMQQILIAAP